MTRTVLPASLISGSAALSWCEKPGALSSCAAGIATQHCRP
jgi:hypothetical protein